MRQAILIALASALITGVAIKAAPALAQEPQWPQARVSIVSTADLDLQTDAGQRLLRQRLARAAREVCGTASDADLAGKNDVLDCRDDVLARASAQGDELAAAARRGTPIAVTASR